MEINIKSNKSYFWLILLLYVGVCQLAVGQHQRSRTNFDFEWKFTLADPQNAMSPTYNDADWTKVQLPHDWSISLPVEKKNGVNMGYRTAAVDLRHQCLCPSPGDFPGDSGGR